ncbi:hypothetical protein TNCV_5116321 [Trichonephila clavipes]|nr:hypothetical protein TNCV_5116321 [Trichonephila clavipes]
MTCGRSSLIKVTELVVKVMDSLLKCHESERNSVEDPPCKGDRCTFHMSRLNHPPFYVTWKYGKDGGGSSGVLFVSCQWLKNTRPLTSGPHAAL